MPMLYLYLTLVYIQSHLINVHWDLNLRTQECDEHMALRAIKERRMCHKPTTLKKTCNHLLLYLVTCRLLIECMFVTVY